MRRLSRSRDETSLLIVGCGCGDTHRGGLYGVTTLSGVSTEDKLRAPRGARMALKDYNDNEAVRSRE